MEAVLRFALKPNQAGISIHEHGIDRNLKQHPQTIALRIGKWIPVPTIHHKQCAPCGNARYGGLLQLVKCAGQRGYAAMSLLDGGEDEPRIERMSNPGSKPR